MTLEEILTSPVTWAALLLSLIQVSPIKIDPWTKLFRWCGKALNGEVLEKVQKMEDKLDKHISDDDARHADTHRQRVLRFNDELIHGVHHSKEHFDDILVEIDDYERYCEGHPNYRNSRAVKAIANINRVYDDLLKTNGFIA